METGSSIVSGSVFDMLVVLPSLMSWPSPGFSVSRLDLARGCRDCLREAALIALTALGVRESRSSSQARSEPLSEECSLSLPSLNQRRGSMLTSPAVCARIQSSVKPRLLRRALLARTAAAALRGWRESASGCDSSGAGRRNGVSMARWCSGESSDRSLLKLCRRRLRCEGG